MPMKCMDPALNLSKTQKILILFFFLKWLFFIFFQVVLTTVEPHQLAGRISALSTLLLIQSLVHQST